VIRLLGKPVACGLSAGGLGGAGTQIGQAKAGTGGSGCWLIGLKCRQIYKKPANLAADFGHGQVWQMSGRAGRVILTPIWARGWK
jgi:hypothetical protein